MLLKLKGKVMLDCSRFYKFLSRKKSFYHLKVVLLQIFKSLENGRKEEEGNCRKVKRQQRMISRVFTTDLVKEPHSSFKSDLQTKTLDALGTPSESSFNTVLCFLGCTP
jgi:NADPH-dependent ferric siderophore reductase